MEQLRPLYLCLLVPMLALVVEGKAASFRHYVLVHGAGHGAWSWYKVHNLLQRAGQNVTSFDLTSAGIDPTDANTVLTIEYYNKPLIEFLSALPDNEKVVLVGHSAGGLCLTHAIHAFGTKKISSAVFVAAIMLRSGFMTADDVKIGFPDLSKAVRPVYGKGPNNTMILTSFSFLPEIIQQILYNRSPEEDVILASKLLKPVPAQPILSARFNSTSTSVDTVARVYVKTRMDRTLKQEMQEAMIKKWPPRKVVAINSDHSPFFSAPRRLVNILLNV
ncbi:putative methylesterase 13 [Nymphaea thermarum]|nr:putative methylesterase 13 [Nymphaea thermarum]